MINCTFIDTHAHLDGEEFSSDLQQTIYRAKDAGCEKVIIPGINSEGIPHILDVCNANPNFAYPALGLHPEEVGANYQTALNAIYALLHDNLSRVVAIGEVGLDYYWSREFYDEQLVAFEEQVKWAVELQLPLIIHCRKGQAEMVKILNKYKDNIVGGIFHCFTGNQQEAAELLSFSNFVLGIGGVLTFKNSKLPETLRNTVPLTRIVLETDSPYMAPVPRRGERNESSFIPYIISRLAETYNVSEQEICTQTTANARGIMPI